MNAEPPQCPAYLATGAELSIELEDSAGTLRMAVVHPVLPFTSSQVVVARLSSKDTATACRLAPGLSVVLKIFDPRFLKRRGPDDDDQPWSEAELEEFQRHKGELTRWCQTLHPDALGMDNWEEFYFLRMYSDHAAEVEAYRMLHPLQGCGVPVFYGSGTLDLSRTAPPCAFNPRLILLEHIADAVSLRDIDPLLLSAPLVESLLDTMQRLGALGVAHGDLNFTNYLFTPARRPTRAVIIDFADSVSRRPDSTDEEWTRLVEEYGVMRETRIKIAMRFTIAGLRVPAACSPEDLPGFGDMNRASLSSL
ncbi:uncharacterized protein PHACADRAFT_97039 [Phanerochaete carnosa HHB-10118-sp]|uniref:Protein kinase domain-containing protein n=1 Tax=Phanerochaete carnosa (strain HHB-10118-sp) TaxID=650164 RepID=K5UVM1_PHACS|nr:uncharacterized protein PHACADRAFT_97039 [Phanerochaete carnosa HHB-10118-sp]EKM54081.1 hypothetical protein PHACADRAFT_97039 [Phanerochaete carnosa HHB-10118-sp]